METQQLGKTQHPKKEEDRPPDGVYTLRCPNPKCGKTHFTVVNSAVVGASFKPLCPSCGKSERLAHHLVYETGGTIQLQAFCGVCKKEHAMFFLGIHRICERCGWEGEFFLGFQKAAP